MRVIYNSKNPDSEGRLCKCLYLTDGKEYEVFEERTLENGRHCYFIKDEDLDETEYVPYEVSFFDKLE